MTAESAPEVVESTREEVRLLAMSVGVREAARRLGLNEDRVRQWSSRGDWFKNPEPKTQPPTVTRNDVTVVTTPADALATQLADDTRATRAALATTARLGSEHFAKKAAESPGFVIDKAKQLQQITSAAGMIGGWGERGQDQGADMLILSIGGNVNLGGQHVHTSEKTD